MPVKTFTAQKTEVEGDIGILNFTLTSVADGDTCSVANFFKTIVELGLTPSTSAGVGATTSAGVITFKVSTGTPDIKVRVGGH